MRSWTVGLVGDREGDGGEERGGRGRQRRRGGKQSRVKQMTWEVSKTDVGTQVSSGVSGVCLFSRVPVTWRIYILLRSDSEGIRT